MVIAGVPDYLVRLPAPIRDKQQTLAAVTSDSNGPGWRRAATSTKRTLAAVSSFFEFVVTVEVYDADNPVRKVDDHALSRVPERHRPFMGKATPGPSCNASQDHPGTATPSGRRGCRRAARGAAHEAGPCVLPEEIF
ncbi:hypothetical protein [Amycolatopsis australiensis]|uniref:hypothetical protein n=1 Tax=Amycolatopsis australiensis TaxID=546364 RepID=UPI00116150B3|nr:hypothetical protein [Amycolatopsis australiensis]